MFNIKAVELDKLIETSYNKTLFQILDKYGDIGLKNAEENVMLSIDFNDNVKIISTGGSVIYSKKGMNYFKNNSNIIIYLCVDFDILSKRTDNFSNRGIIFNGLSPRKLYTSRHKLYNKYCDISIECNNMSVKEISEFIYNHFI